MDFRRVARPTRDMRSTLEAARAPEARAAILGAVLATDASRPARDVLRALHAEVADAAPRGAAARAAGGVHRSDAGPARTARRGDALAAAGRWIAALALHAAQAARPRVQAVGTHVRAEAASGAARWAAPAVQVETDAVDAELIARPALLALTATCAGVVARMAATVAVATSLARRVAASTGRDGDVRGWRDRAVVHGWNGAVEEGRWGRKDGDVLRGRNGDVLRGRNGAVVRRWERG